MKFVKHLLFLAVLLFSTQQAQAQREYIFTNYYMSPMTLNPAMVGAYEGTYRVGALQRQQWNIAPSIYQTTSAFVDMPLLMIKKRHWIGAGLSLYNDGAGSGGDFSKLGQNYVALSAAFHYSLDKKFKNVLTFGLAAGAGQDGFTPGIGPQTASDYAVPGGNTTTLIKDKASLTDISAGIMLKSKIDKKSDLSLGVSLRHLNTASNALKKAYKAVIAKDSSSSIPAAFTFHAEYNRMLNKKLTISPNILYRKIAGSQDVSLQAVLGYQIDPKRKDLILKGGLGARVFGNHAINVLLGADYQNFKLMVGYDIPTAPVSGKTTGSTLELALHYTGKVYKNPVVKGIHFCPKY